MSFTFGGFNTATMPGLFAGMKSWISLPGLSLDTVDAPGSDGVFFAGANLGAHPGFAYDVYVQASSRAGCQTMVDHLTQTLSPMAGLQDFTPGGWEGWVWRAVLARQSEWSFGTWLPGSPWQMRCDMAFYCPDPYGYASPDEGVTWTTAGSRTFTRLLGNMTSYPSFDIKGTLNSSQAVTLTVNGTAVTVTSPLTSSQLLRMDYQTMDFGVWDSTGTTKLSSVVGQMSAFDRLTLPVGASTVALATTGTLTSCQMQANSRRS